ncbi:DUF3124 domain-containing protein [Geomonas sp. RF6]|uniref:DUF3124 domain-containing protein n=1 Tax=Geomonas sp. RF6 TaxID=2897342 RepID=UPI001E64B350|nr:DUF3124 domain-containing protein [Geomonas sp. RF6]UFS71950.1 DUF3124 domain-containing protein [Geomonas sp. RF6]
MRLQLFLSAVLLAASISGPTFAAAANDVRLSSGQTVYVSVYSNLPIGPRARPVSLETVLTIRNTDMKRGLTISSIDYYDTDGKVLRRHLASPLALGPLATKYIHVKEGESAGGPGSNFIVRWRAAKPMNPPIVESVMLSARGGQGISFVIPGQVISEE